MSARQPAQYPGDGEFHAIGQRLDRLEARLAKLERRAVPLNVVGGEVGEGECTDMNGAVVPGGPR